jgi:hypothetical protein
VLTKLFEGIGAVFGYGFWPSSTEVEQSTHNPSIKGSNPAAGIGSKDKVKR